MSSRWLAGLLIVLLACVSSGCGGPSTPGGIIVAGRVLNDGKPMELVRPDVGVGMLEIALVPDGAGGAGKEVTKADKDGNFEFRGPGNGVPPGAYKLVVRHWKNGMGTKDELDGRFTEEKTPIKVDVPGSLIGKKHDLGVLELSSYGKPGAKG